MMNVRSAWAAAALALLLSACVKAACPKTPITDPGRALEARGYDPGAIRSLRAEAKVDQRGQGSRIKGRVLMFVERPNQVRFDVMTQFGPALIFTSDGYSFALSDFKENRYLSGLACPQNIARLVGVALSGEAVASVLMGDVPEIPALGQQLTCRGGAYVVTRQGQDGSHQELELAVRPGDEKLAPEAQHTDLSAFTHYDASGKKLYRVRYEDYRAVGDGSARLPFTVRIDDYQNDSDALLRFQSIDVNVKVPAGAFEQTPRGGLSVEEVSCE